MQSQSEPVPRTLRNVLNGTYKKPLTEKAKMYINKYPSINEAFSRAKYEDSETLESIYNEGVDINFDVNVPNGMNMFRCSINAHGVCDPHFLKMMFTHGRMDIKTDGQHVFEMVCGYGDVRHIEVFMDHYDETGAGSGNDFQETSSVDGVSNHEGFKSNIDYFKSASGFKWDIFAGMDKAVMTDNRTNFHHLMMYYAPLSVTELEKLWDRASGSYIHGTKTLIYMMHFLNCTITEEKVLNSIINHFIDALAVILHVYLRDGGKPFKIAKDVVDKILSGTSDRMHKLALLSKNGFEIEGYEEIKNVDEATLPRPSCSRYVTFAM